MVLRTKDIKGRYFVLSITIADVFSEIKMLSAFTAKRFKDTFDEIVITDREEPLFRHHLAKYTNEIYAYFKALGLDRQGYIPDESKIYIYGKDIPNQVLKIESSDSIEFYLFDNNKVSDSDINIIDSDIQTWFVKSLFAEMINSPEIKKEEFEQKSLGEIVGSKIFYLTLK